MEVGVRTADQKITPPKKLERVIDCLASNNVQGWKDFVAIGDGKLLGL